MGVKTPDEHQGLQTHTEEWGWRVLLADHARVDVPWSGSGSLDGFAFQACSIDHSDISPFRINDLRAISNTLSRDRA